MTTVAPAAFVMSVAMRRAQELAVSRLHVVSDVEDWSSPSVMAALAGILHDRQAAAGHDTTTLMTINKRAFMCGLH